MFVIIYRKVFLWIALVIVASALAIVATLGLRLGIDFTGGTLIEVSYERVPEQSEVSDALAPLGLGDPLIRRSETEAGAGYLISVRELSPEEQETVRTAVLALGEGGVITRTTSIGPVIGEEMKAKAVWAIGGVLLIIVVYLAFAFAGIGKPVNSWVYGLMTIAVLGHDILVPIAVMSVLGYVAGAEVDVLFITALLTILGYSVNDTIVIFDRVREKLLQYRTAHTTTVIEPGGLERKEVTYTLTKPFGDLVGMAVSETMARSINTSLTVLLALTALFFLGSSVTQTFVIVLMAGVVAGAFSSIFIASPLLVTYARWQEARQQTTASRK